MIFLAKLLIFLKRLIAAFFVGAIKGPGRWLLRFVFYKVLVKLYKFYLYLIKKTGWRSLGEKSLVTLLNQKSIHFVVVAITAVLIFTNLTTKTKAESLSDKASNTIIASLIESEFGSLEENKLIEEFFDQEAVISPTQQNYLDNLVSVKVEPSVSTDAYGEQGNSNGVNFLSEGTGMLVKPEVVSTKKSKRPRAGIVEYVVMPGDSISTIASEYEISVSSILWENNLSAYSVIRPGDKLAILPTSGISHGVLSGENLSSIAKKYGVEESVIIETNKLTDSSKLAVGQKLIIPGGSKNAYTPASKKSYSGISAIRDIVKSPDAIPVSGNTMNWPTEGHRITQYYSWRHTGLDIGNKIGTPIYSADAGTVEYVGWGKGYGNQIVVNHGGGKKTRYAHLSKFYVKQGQAVGKGESIGAMGSTGWSTGPHLHFEVIINNGKYNPLNYIK